MCHQNRVRITDLYVLYVAPLTHSGVCLCDLNVWSSVKWGLHQEVTQLYSMRVFPRL